VVASLGIGVQANTGGNATIYGDPTQLGTILTAYDEGLHADHPGTASIAIAI
jgi:Na+/H+ antiporter NhaD/arsenite permease-like protein